MKRKDLTSHQKAAKKGWKNRKKNFTEEQISEQNRKGGLKSVEKRLGYKQSYEEVL